MATRTLTDAFAKSEKAKPREKNGKLCTADYWDSKTRGFGLRVTAADARSWNVLYRVHGAQRRITLGDAKIMSLGEARDLAVRVKLDARKGIDAAAEERKKRDAAMAAKRAIGGDTFAALCDRYLAEYASRKRSGGQDESLIRRVLKPAWGDRKQTDISRQDAIDLLSRIKRRGTGHVANPHGAPVMANRVRALVSKIFGWAFDEGIIGADPTASLPKRHNDEDGRTRRLSEDEIRKFWTALDSKGAKIAGIFRLALLTAQRCSEVMRLPWSEINFDKREWTLPAARSKNKREHLVPLAPRALEILKELRDSNNGSAYVFPSRRSVRGSKPLTSVTMWIRRLQDELKFSEPWQFRDLRRTAATGMGEARVPKFIVARVLNHSDRSVTSRYDLYDYADEKRDALERWDKRLGEILRLETPKADASEISSPSRRSEIQLAAF